MAVRDVEEGIRGGFILSAMQYFHFPLTMVKPLSDDTARMAVCIIKSKEGPMVVAEREHVQIAYIDSLKRLERNA
jgi:hypothetical protein